MTDDEVDEYIDKVGDLIENYLEEKGVPYGGISDPDSKGPWPAAILHIDQITPKFYLEIVYPGIEEICNKWKITLTVKEYVERDGFVASALILKPEVEKIRCA